MPVESSNNTGVRAPALAALARCLAAGPTLAAQIDGRANNFNVLRLAAALAVLFGHSFVLAAGHQDFASVDPVSRVLMQVTGFGEAIHELAVNLFFVVSGFLVTRSLQQRASLADFVEARVLRLFPAAIVSTVLTIVGLSFLSTLPAAAYFTDPETWEYLLRNTLVWSVDYDLPGVFADNPYPVAVNGSLWTLPVELRCYLLVLLLGVAGLARRQSLANVALCIPVILYLVPEWSHLLTRDPAKWRLFLFFIVGSFFCINRRSIPVGWFPAAALLGLYAATANLPRLHGIAFVVLVAYLTLALALVRHVRWLDPGRFGDISYGVYLYAFPVQQALIHALPDIRNGWSLAALAAAATLPLAVLSWIAVERPALAAKGTLARLRRSRRERAAKASSA